MKPDPAGSGPIVDRADWSDRAALTRLLTDYFAELALTFEDELDYDLTDPLAGYADGAILVVRRGDGLIGCLGLRRLTEAGPDTAEIKRTYLAPQARGLGLARNLLDRAIETARELGFRRIVLDTMSRLTAANRLYRAYGFVDIPRYNNNHRADVFMEFILD